MPTLSEITKKSKSLSDTISKRVATYAPKKTGNLRDALRRANTVDTMFEIQGGSSKGIPVKSLTFTYNYAPDDAKYGMWWNEPTLAKNIKNGNTKNIPDSINFAEKGLNDPNVISAINELVDLIGESVLLKIQEELKEL